MQIIALLQIISYVNHKNFHEHEQILQIFHIILSYLLKLKIKVKYCNFNALILLTQSHGIVALAVSCPELTD